MHLSKNTFFFLFALAVLVALGAVSAWRNTARRTESETPALTSALIASEKTFDFGSISMAKGVVTHPYVVKNTGTVPLTVKKMYTSCMCTTASFEKEGRTFGPFGMPGHTAIPVLNQVLAPGEELTVVAAFDPAAHGPSGVGRISRVVTIETDQGKADLAFNAFVTP